MYEDLDRAPVKLYFESKKLIKTIEEEENFTLDKVNQILENARNIKEKWKVHIRLNVTTEREAVFNKSLIKGIIFLLQTKINELEKSP